MYNANVAHHDRDIDAHSTAQRRRETKKVREREQDEEWMKKKELTHL